MIESIKKMDEMFKRRATQVAEAKQKGIKLIGYVCSYTPPEINPCSRSNPHPFSQRR